PLLAAHAAVRAAAGGSVGSSVCHAADQSASSAAPATASVVGDADGVQHAAPSVQAAGEAAASHRARAADSAASDDGTEHALTADQLWSIFCARIANFPARYAVYRHYRTAGWVVRDGLAFGCDFVLYAKGPGWDHAPHCITVMPLTLLLEDATPLENARAVDSSAPSTDASGAHTAPAVVHVRLPTANVLRTWQEVHALGRVINTVKKHTLLAYVSLPVPPSVFMDATASAAAAAGWYGVCASALLMNKACAQRIPPKAPTAHKMPMRGSPRAGGCKRSSGFFLSIPPCTAKGYIRVGKKKAGAVSAPASFSNYPTRRNPTLPAAGGAHAPTSGNTIPPNALSFSAAISSTATTACHRPSPSVRSSIISGLQASTSSRAANGMRT
ncbi:hypothetical protein EON62_02060, partial [archaeon]